MKKLFVFLALFCCSLGAVSAQFTSDKLVNVAGTAFFSQREYAEYEKDLSMTESVFINADRLYGNFGIYASANNIGWQRPKDISADSFIDLDVNEAFDYKGAEEIEGPLTTKLGSVGMGISYALADRFFLYGGAGRGFDGKPRFNAGTFYQDSLVRVSAFADIAQADWRYDMSAMIWVRNEILRGGIGVYAKTRLGVGFMGSVSTADWIELRMGGGQDYEYPGAAGTIWFELAFMLDQWK